MKISAKAEYACLALIELAHSGRDDPRRVREIAGSQGISGRYLVQILLQLKAAGLVESARGSQGGYHLARPADAISLAEVVSAIDGPGDPAMKMGSPAARELGESFTRAHEAWLRVLSSITVEILASRVDPHGDHGVLADYTS